MKKNMNILFSLTIVIALLVFSMIPNSFAEVDYNKDLKFLIKDFNIYESDDLDILQVFLSISNNGNERFESWLTTIFMVDTQGRLFETSPYMVYDYDFLANDDCETFTDSINPGLTKTIPLCYEIPKNLNKNFHLKILSSPQEVCDMAKGNQFIEDCQEKEINLPSPNAISINEPEVTVVVPDNSELINSLKNENLELKKEISQLESANKKLQSTIDELEKKLTESGDSTPKIKKEIASFVDKTKDPQSYVDRYKKESSYKEWFDENYPDYDSIYEAVGKRQPVPDWIKNNAIWWSEGKLSEDEFVGGIEYLVKNKIINVD